MQKHWMTIKAVSILRVLPKNNYSEEVFFLMILYVRMCMIPPSLLTFCTQNLNGTFYQNRWPYIKHVCICRTINEVRVKAFSVNKYCTYQHIQNIILNVVTYVVIICKQQLCLIIIYSQNLQGQVNCELCLLVRKNFEPIFVLLYK